MGDKLTMTCFRAGEEQAGQTLVTALRGWLPDRSWSQLRKLVRARRITVNDTLCMDEGRRMGVGDNVQVLAESRPPPPGPERVWICHLDDHLVVVDKPSGMLSERHRAERNWPWRRKQQQPTLDEIVPRLIAGRQRQQPGRRRMATQVFGVHRIDRDTSGLLVFARNEQAQQRLITQFAAHDVDRIYWALVPGTLRARTVASLLIRDRGDGLRGSSLDADRGRRAVTHIRPLESLGDYTLLECRLETGRTHQIRIHLAELGHPVCGDSVYRGSYGNAPMEDTSGAPRPALHAARLGFAHPVHGEPLSLEAPLPKDLERLVMRLRAG